MIRRLICFCLPLFEASSYCFQPFLIISIPPLHNRRISLPEILHMQHEQSTGILCKSKPIVPDPFFAHKCRSSTHQNHPQQLIHGGLTHQCDGFDGLRCLKAIVVNMHIAHCTTHNSTSQSTAHILPLALHCELEVKTSLKI